jgi:hypothetical protein
MKLRAKRWAAHITPKGENIYNFKKPQGKRWGNNTLELQFYIPKFQLFLH